MESVYGYESDSVPSWEEALQIWAEKAEWCVGEPKEGDRVGHHHSFQQVSDTKTVDAKVSNEIRRIIIAEIELCMFDTRQMASAREFVHPSVRWNHKFIPFTISLHDHVPLRLGELLSLPYKLIGLIK